MEKSQNTVEIEKEDYRNEKLSQTTNTHNTPTLTTLQQANHTLTHKETSQEKRRTT